jgi:ribosomal protein S18 acetylase RimI-like enzyme
MITYREATNQDAELIAQLHSISWQENYKAIWNDDFLKGPVLQNRRQVWQQRLNQPNPDQHIIVAQSMETLCGFTCAYYNNDPVWGTLLDNLHVQASHKGQGIGTALIKLAARWSYTKDSKSGFFLWVLEQNTPARSFYEKLGAINQGWETHANPGGGSSIACRYAWPDIAKLILAK